MIIPWLLAAHIAVVGYWLGSELVINGTYRYVAFADRMPFAERARLMDHVMHVDQHVRYALVLQAALGTALAALYGYVPGGTVTAVGAAVVGMSWLAFVEAVHRLRGAPSGRALAAIDRGSRYLLMAALVALAAGLVGGDWPLPAWLRWKLALFAAVMACGVGIRFALIVHFRTWALMAADGPTPAREAVVRRTYWRATSILALLWMFIAAITVLSIWKPA
jgi:hypothetical protein